MIVFSNTVFAQKIVIKGKIIDQLTKQGLFGATISIDSITSITDEKGVFSISTDLNILINKPIFITSVGYIKQRIPYQTNHLYEIEMMHNVTQLKEVIVRSADFILKKAVQNIPQNYPQTNFKMKGILRLYNFDMDTVGCYYFSKTDASINIYHKSYQIKNSPPSNVSVISNKLTILKDSHHGDTLNRIGVDSYFLPDERDFVRFAPFIQNSKKFNYLLEKEMIMNGNPVYQISFKNKVDTANHGVIYIDTLSYAFVALQDTLHNVRRFLHLPQEVQINYVTYKKINDRWYLDEVHGKTVTFPLFHNYTFYNIYDFKGISIDTTEKVNDTKVISRVLKQTDINKSQGNNSSEFEKLFKDAELTGVLRYIPSPTISTKTIVIKQSRKVE